MGGSNARDSVLLLRQPRHIEGRAIGNTRAGRVVPHTTTQATVAGGSIHAEADSAMTASRPWLQDRRGACCTVLDDARAHTEATAAEPNHRQDRCLTAQISCHHGSLVGLNGQVGAGQDIWVMERS